MRRRFCRSAKALLGAAASLLLAGSLTPARASAAQDEIAAVFKLHELQFVYRSLVNPLDCSELRNHIAVILSAVGARDDVKVRVTNCELFLFNERSPASDDWDRYGMPRSHFSNDLDRLQTSNIRIEVMFPVEATPEVLAEIDKDKSRRELISRVTGNPLAAMNDPVIFPVQRREVTLSRASIRLGPEDCELLEQMIPTVFRTLNVKVTGRQFSCDTHRRSAFAPKVVVETLWPVGMPVPGEKQNKK
jgi:hypothetical protein